MEQATFDLIAAFNAEGLDNSELNFCEDVESTKRFWGTNIDISLKGKYLYLFYDKDKIYSMIDKFQPTLIIPSDDKIEMRFYKLL